MRDECGGRPSFNVQFATYRSSQQRFLAYLGYQLDMSPFAAIMIASARSSGSCTVSSAMFEAYADSGAPGGS